MNEYGKIEIKIIFMLDTNMIQTNQKNDKFYRDRYTHLKMVIREPHVLGFPLIYISDNTHTFVWQ